MPVIRSRINQFIPSSLMAEMEKLCRNPTISDNNLKVEGMLALLNKYNVDHVELGPGTNRLAVLIDNYVFKIALDKWGQQDNANEFAISEELQPYVIKTYELSSNHVITVCEYITVISREEFMEQADVLRDILSILAESYLLGDVGVVPKNFTNWGYRDNGDLVILDFAYIYPVQGNELLCSEDQTILDYDKNFHNLFCPRCQRKYSFMDVRRKVTMAHEKYEQDMSIAQSYQLTLPVQEFKEATTRYSEQRDDVTNSSYTENKSMQPHKEESIMEKRYDENQEEQYVSEEEAYENKLEELEKKFRPAAIIEEAVEVLDVADHDRKDTEINVVEIERTSENERTSLRIISERHVDADTATDNIVKGLQSVNEASELLEETSEWAHVTSLANNALGEVEETEEQDLDMYAQLAKDASEGKIDYDDIKSDDGESTTDESSDDNEDNDNEETGEEEEHHNEPLEGEIVEHDDAETVDAVIFKNEVEVTDNITIRNEIEVRGSSDVSVDELRASLKADVEDKEYDSEFDKQLEELADEYRHLEEEADEENNNRRYRNNRNDN